MRASINYAANPEDLVPFVLDHDWSGIDREAAHVEITDARPLARQLSLDEHGFVIDRLQTPPIDYLDPAQVGRHWVPAVAQLVRRLTGAAQVLPWGVNVRFSNSSSQSERTKVAAPARHVHCDFTAGFDPTRQILFDAPTFVARGITGGRHPLIERKPRSWRCFNVWQQISPPPSDTPLALCDARSVDARDLVLGRARYDASPYNPAGSVDLSLFRRNPRHRWYYFSSMEPGEALVFSGLDPARGPTCRMVPHIAFDDPDCPPGSPPRNSIEVRVLVVLEA